MSFILFLVIIYGLRVCNKHLHIKITVIYHVLFSKYVFLKKNDFFLLKSAFVTLHIPKRISDRNNFGLLGAAIFIEHILHPDVSWSNTNSDHSI